MPVLFSRVRQSQCLKPESHKLVYRIRPITTVFPAVFVVLSYVAKKTVEALSIVANGYGHTQGKIL